MRYHGKNGQEKGIALIVALMVLTITSIFVMSIGSVGIMNLTNQAGYRASVTARYAARAAVAEAIAQAEASSNQGTQTPTYGQTSADSFSITLSNNIPAAVNFTSTGGIRFSVNNMSGITTTLDGMGYQVPAGYMKINGYATVNGKTAVASALATLAPDGSYAVLTQSKIEASDVSGSVRNNLTAAGANDTIELDSLTGTATSTDPNPDHIDVTGTPTGTEVTSAAIFPIPDIDIPTIVASKNTAASYQTDSAGFEALLSACSNILVPTCAALGGKTVVYVDASTTGGIVTLTGAYDISLRDGIQVYINGSIRINGNIDDCTVSNPSQANALFVTGYIDINGASGSNLSLIAGGVPTKSQGSDTNNAIMISGSSNFTGFVYTRTGHVDMGSSTSSFTGNIMCKNGELQASGTDITYSPNYMKAFAVEMPPNALRMRATASW